jgi:hypothetical protein
MLGTMAKRAAIKKVLIPLSSFWPIATPDRSLKFRRAPLRGRRGGENAGRGAIALASRARRCARVLLYKWRGSS